MDARWPFQALGTPPPLNPSGYTSSMYGGVGSAPANATFGTREIASGATDLWQSLTGLIPQTTDARSGVEHINVSYVAKPQPNGSEKYLEEGCLIFKPVNDSEFGDRPTIVMEEDDPVAQYAKFYDAAVPRTLFRIPDFNGYIGHNYDIVQNMLEEPVRISQFLGLSSDMNESHMEALRRHWPTETWMRSMLSDHVPQHPNGLTLELGEKGYRYDRVYNGQPLSNVAIGGDAEEKRKAQQLALHICQSEPFNCAWSTTIRRRWDFVGVVDSPNNLAGTSKRLETGDTQTGIPTPTITVSGYAEKVFNHFAWPRPTTTGCKLYLALRKGGYAEKDTMIRKATFESDRGQPFQVVGINTTSFLTRQDRMFYDCPPIPADGTIGWNAENAHYALGDTWYVGTALSQGRNDELSLANVTQAAGIVRAKQEPIHPSFTLAAVKSLGRITVDLAH